MPRPLSPSLTLLTLLLTFLFNPTFSQSVHAQSFRPIPDSGRCSGFTEGQGLYIVGGHGAEANFTAQIFMLDLSVSWNTSDPVFKKIQDGPMTTGQACTMTNNGEDLFVLSRGTGYTYSVKSDSWNVFHNNEFPNDSGGLSPAIAAADPTTGFIYIFQHDRGFSNKIVLAVDIRTWTVNNINLPVKDFDSFKLATWSAHLKAMLVFPPVNISSYTFTPNEIVKSMKGWGDLNILKQQPEDVVIWDCVAPAYNGSKMVLLGRDYINQKGVIYILDVVKQTLKGAPATGFLGIGACAVTGDQFIVWGGDNGSKQSNETHVFNLKTEKWVTRYIAPRPSPTSQLPQPPQTPTQQPDLGDTSSNEKKLVNIIIIVIGALLAIILTAISVYIGISKRMEIVTQGSVTVLFRGTFGRRDPSGISPDSHVQHRWYSSSLLSWLYRGPNGARPPPEHPHAVVELEMRNVQEGAVEVQFPAQHPHATVDHGSASSQNYKAEWESISSRDNNQELVVR